MITEAQMMHDEKMMAFAVAGIVAVGLCAGFLYWMRCYWSRKDAEADARNNERMSHAAWATERCHWIELANDRLQAITDLMDIIHDREDQIKRLQRENKRLEKLLIVKEKNEYVQRKGAEEPSAGIRD